MSEILDAALQYASWQWFVFPTWGIAKDGFCECGDQHPKHSAGKHPRLNDWPKKCSKTPAVIKRWWDKWPMANVAIATGIKSNFWVLDIDPDKGGLETIAALESLNARLPTTFMVNTGGNGWHYYFEWPKDGRIISNRGSLGPGVDVRGEGGYVMAPPSRHISGRRYVSATGIH